MKRIVLLAFIIRTTFEQCQAGCLKCTPQNTCIICDSPNFYALNGTACILTPKPNCSIINQIGNCVTCFPNFFFDSNTNNCLKVPTTSLVANCLIYNSGQSCVTCLPNFFISLGSCSIVNITVQNCQTYSSNGVCGSCMFGFIFSIDFSTCVPLTNLPNCLAYTYIICKTCATNFLFNQNLYLFPFNTTPSLTSLLYPNPNSQNYIQLSVCQATNISNCIIFSSYNNCSACASNYYLFNNTCIANPITPIQNCLTYSSLTACLTCQTGFFLSGSRCLANIIIVGCQVYDNTAISNVCLKCNNTAYVKNNACFNRTASLNITFCLVVSLVSDSCLSCNPGYNTTSDNLACLPMLQNCQTYVNSIFSHPKFVCSLCSEGFYVVNNSTGSFCVQGSIGNCSIYTTNANTCSICLNGFYKSGNACLQHVLIPNCSIYSQTSQNQCNVCSIGFYNFVLTQVCSLVPTIDNCIQYSLNGLTCTNCQNGYFLNQNTCVLIPNSSPYCLTFSNGVCTSCLNGFVLNVFSTNNMCTPFVDYVISNCDLGNMTINGYCSICQTNSYYYVPKQSEAICVLSSDLSNFSTFSSVPQCIRYGLNYANSPSIVCMECQIGSFLSNYWQNGILSTATSCLSSCFTLDGSNIYIPDDFYGFVNICVPSGVLSSQINFPGCQKLARISSFNGRISDFVCVQPTGVYTAAFSVIPTTAFSYESSTSSLISALNSDTANNSVDFAHGIYILDGISITPKVFNYRGVLINLLLTSTLSPASSLTNCDIIFQLGSTGSIFQANGALSGGYLSGSGTIYSCLRCNYGFQPAFTVTASTGNANTPVCQTMGTTCSSQVVILGGLPSFLNSAISCHSCITIAGVINFPTLYIEYDATVSGGFGTFLQFSFPVITSGFISPLHGFRCSPQPITITNSITTPSTGNQVSQCAIYGVFSAQTSGNQDPSLVINICLACATGNFPIYLAVSGTQVAASPTFAPSYMITSCIKSNKCDPNPLNMPYNSCGRCTLLEQVLSPPNFYAYSDYRLINCLPVRTPNCFIISPSSPSTSVASICLICQAGFYLNIDGFCDLLTIPNASTNSSFINSYFVNKIATFQGSKVSGFDIAWSRIHYLLSFSNAQYGVRNCTNGYIRAAPSIVAPGFCVISNYLTNAVLLANSNFIPNCSKYSFSNPVSNIFQCRFCTSGFIPTSTSLLCVPRILNCLQALASNTILCNVCQTGFINLSGGCMNSVIANCITYQNTVQYNVGLTVLTCSGCANGFYLQTTGQITSCLPGSILNCASYSGNSATNCLTCLPNYNLIVLSNSVIYCYPVLTLFSNCQMVINNGGTGGINGFKQGFINCGSCSQTGTSIFGISTMSASNIITQPQSVCMPFNPIANCANYDQLNSILSANTFNCLNCISAYYYQTSNNSCILRQNLDPQCQNFSQTLDQCSICLPGYFFSTLKASCIIFPSGVPFCTIYQNATTCITCTLNYFLANNTCTLSTLIPECLTYSANNTCSGCVFGYFLLNNTCVNPIANNCATYANISACETCPAAFGLLKSATTIDCVDSVIGNCLKTTPNAPFSCLTCQTGYFPDVGGVCSQIVTTIANCLVYDTNLTCFQCVSGAVLSFSKTFCDTFSYLALIDPKCTFSYISKNPVCLFCNPGSYFVNGSCVVYNQDGALKGCYFINPLNITSCAVCSPGYFQSANGDCTQYVFPAPIKANSSNNTTYTASSQNFGHVYWLMMILVMYFVR